MVRMRNLHGGGKGPESPVPATTLIDGFIAGPSAQNGMDQHDKEMEEEEECTDVVQPCLHYYLAAAKDSGAAEAAAAEGPTIYTSMRV
ncbi:unnamed protein product [Sphagnum balticum]